MAGLKSLDKKKRDPKEGKRMLLVLVPTIMVLSLVSIIAIGAGAYISLDKSEHPAVETTSTTIPTNSIITTTTAKPTTTITSTSTTSSTTTTLCGGEFQEPCAENECDLGFIVGSTGLCQPLECAPSVAKSGDGCGGFALSFCRG